MMNGQVSGQTGCMMDRHVDGLTGCLMTVHMSMDGCAWKHTYRQSGGRGGVGWEGRGGAVKLQVHSEGRGPLDLGSKGLENVEPCR